MKNQKELQLQYDELSERAVLGYLLIDNSGCDYVFSLLSVDDFHREKHKILFKCFQKIWDEGKKFDINIVSSQLEGSGELKLIGGTSSISELIDGIPAKINIDPYIEILKEKSKARALFLSALDLLRECSQPLCDTESVLQNHHDTILRLNDSGSKKLVPFSELSKESVPIVEKIQSGEIATGIKTGYTQLDELTGGFQDGDFIVIAARPSMGKTALALNMANYIATKLNKTVGFFSIETGGLQIWLRLVSIESEVRGETLRLADPVMGKTEWSRYTGAVEKLNDSGIFINDSSRLTLLEIKSIVQSMVNQLKIDIVFIDYLQLVKIPDSMLRKNDTRVQEVSAISAGLKSLAKEQKIPVVAMAQLNRMPEKRSADSIKYQLSDLKESGAIEQDADVVMFLHRDEQNNRDTERKGEADLIIAKQRNGPTGDIVLGFHSEIGKFTDMKYGHDMKGYRDDGLF